MNPPDKDVRFDTIKEDCMIINHNISAMFAQRQLRFNNLDVNKDMEKLSSGYRINRAGDDASGLAISETISNEEITPRGRESSCAGSITNTR